MSADNELHPNALARLEAAELELATLLEGAVRLAAQLADVREALTPAPPEAPEIASARLVALDLLLSGKPRDEVVLRLAVDFPGIDAAAVVDDAAATSGG